jgi:hypothetical protein
MNTNQIIKYGILGIIALFIFGIFMIVISLSNQEVDLRNRYKQKMDERTAFYDKMWKTISQKSKVALKNDSSFSNNVNAIMAGRKDAQGIFMKWVQESNPNSNFAAVSSLYADLSRAIEAQRDGFFMEEKMIQSIVLEHDNIMTRFPTGWILSSFMGRTRLTYKPITSDRTDEVIKSGKDNNVEVF